MPRRSAWACSSRTSPRDVAEDWWRSRCYLPIEWTDGLRPDGGPPDPARVRRGVRTILEVANTYSTAGQAGIAVLDAESRLAVRVAARIYHAIGIRIRRRGYEVLDERVRVSTIAKFGLFAGAMLNPAGGRLRQRENPAGPRRFRPTEPK
jgi:phytoene synthase